MKKETHLRGYIDRRPYRTLGTLADLATPPGPRGRTGQRAMVNHVVVTDPQRPSRSA